MSEVIIILILAITIYFALEYGRGLGDYSCPSYCKVEHKHIIDKKEK